MFINGYFWSFIMLTMTFRRLEEKGPFGNVFLQECYYMNALLSTVRSSLRLLDLALKGGIHSAILLPSLQNKNQL